MPIIGYHWQSDSSDISLHKVISHSCHGLFQWPWLSKSFTLTRFASRSATAPKLWQMEQCGLAHMTRSPAWKAVIACLWDCYSLPLRLFISAVESPWLFLSFISNQLQRQKWSCLQHRRGNSVVWSIGGHLWLEKSMGFNTARLASLNSAGKLKWLAANLKFPGRCGKKDLRSATENCWSIQLYERSSTQILESY